jgi:hypothetical protein
MKNTLIALAVLTTAACATTDGKSAITPEMIDKAQTAALFACVLFPTAKEIADVYVKDSKSVENAEKIADILCAAAVKAGVR